MEYETDHFINTVHKFTADLELVLDFVERWNKLDAERDVAEATHRLASYFDITV